NLGGCGGAYAPVTPSLFFPPAPQAWVFPLRPPLPSNLLFSPIFAHTPPVRSPLPPFGPPISLLSKGGRRGKRLRRGTILLAAALAASTLSCSEKPRDVTPPSPPRGVFSVTGDQSASIHWLSNNEGDLAGYNVYVSDCPGGPSCPYRRIGTTSGIDFVATGLANGTTYYFAVAAFDYSGNESELSLDDVFDTPRPAGSGAQLLNFVTNPTGATAWDFSSASALRSDDPQADVYFGDNGSVSL